MAVPMRAEQLQVRDVLSCARCHSTVFIDNPIKDGATIRRDWACCGIIAHFPVCYRRQSEIKNPLAAAFQIAPIPPQLKARCCSSSQRDGFAVPLMKRLPRLFIGMRRQFEFIAASSERPTRFATRILARDRLPTY